MTIALCATALVILALLSEITWPMIERRLDQRRARKEAKRHGVPAPYDPSPFARERHVWLGLHAAATRSLAQGSMIVFS